MGYKQKSTDEHYTPPHIYEIVKDWAEDTYKLAGKKIIRPFYPGEDYQRHDYDTDCVVIDNPPFSILSEITGWYIKRSIRFFLFAPALTAFSANKPGLSYVITNSKIKYLSGLQVLTNFVTNLDTTYKIRLEPELAQKLKTKSQSPSQGYIWPKNLISGATLGKYVDAGLALKIKPGETR